MSTQVNGVDPFNLSNPLPIDMLRCLRSLLRADAVTPQSISAEMSKISYRSQLYLDEEILHCECDDNAETRIIATLPCG